jgi:hypothetical protein
MDRVNHLWPDIARLVPKSKNNTKNLAVFVAWLYASDATTAGLSTSPHVWLWESHLPAKRLRCAARVMIHRNELRNDSGLCARFNVVDSTAMLEWVAQYGHAAHLASLRDWGFGVHHARRVDVLKKAADCGRLDIINGVKEWRDLTHPEPHDINEPDNASTKSEYKCLTLHDLRQDHSALRRASLHGHVHVIQAFREWGITLADVREARALGCAAEHGHVHVLQYFKDWQDTKPDGTVERLSVRDVLESRALVNAAENGHAHVLAHLKDAWHLTTNDARAGNNEALRLIGISGDLKCLVFLREQWHLTLDDARAQKNLLLRRAAAYGHMEVLRCLREWVDPVKPGDPEPIANWLHRVTHGAQQSCPIQDRLTLEDVRSKNNFALKWAACSDRLEVLKFFREWRDINPDGSVAGLGEHDVRLALHHAHAHGETTQFLEEWLIEVS